MTKLVDVADAIGHGDNCAVLSDFSRSCDCDHLERARRAVERLRKMEPILTRYIDRVRQEQAHCNLIKLEGEKMWQTMLDHILEEADG